MKFWQAISHLGTVVALGLLMLILIPFSLEWSLAIFFLLVFSTLVIYAIKYFFPTPRPDHGKPIKHWFDRFDQGSFPSAHAARLIGLLVISRFIGNTASSIMIGVLFVLISYSRLVLRRHFLKDIVGGALFGVVFGLAALLCAFFVLPLLDGLLR